MRKKFANMKTIKRIEFQDLSRNKERFNFFQIISFEIILSYMWSQTYFKTSYIGTINHLQWSEKKPGMFRINR